MFKIDFEKEIKMILSQQKVLEDKLDVIIKDLKKHLSSRGKPTKANDQQPQKKPKKKIKFICCKL
jgi:hypothetical protein